MYELRVGEEIFLCGCVPEAVGGIAPEAQALRSLATEGPKPALLYWDGRVIGRGDPVLLHLGHGGLDAVLASERDLAGCVGVSGEAFHRLMRRGAISGDGDLARAVALLARAPGLVATRCEGLVGEIDLRASGPFPSGRGPGSHSDTISIVVIVDEPEHSVEPFFAALKGQAIQTQLDVVVLALGFESPDLRELARTLEVAGAADPRLSIRRYALSGQFGPAYVANIGVALATSEATLLADVRCVPVSPNAVQQLADWCQSGDAVSACPKILHDGRLLAAGLALGSAAPDGEAPLVLWNDLLLADELRTAAAPAPWFFAIRRSAWLSVGGLKGAADPLLWSAELSAANAPKGRTLLVGSESAEWTGVDPPVALGATSPSHRRLQGAARTAVREPTPFNRSAPQFDWRGQLAGTSASQPKGSETEGDAAFSDAFVGQAGLKILVFADAYGPSQSIVFVDGLAAARASGAAAVRIVDEAAFPGDSRTLDESPAAAVVARHMKEVEPHVIVVSRLGHSAAWTAIRSAARGAGVPVVFHMDDDLFDLPVVLGIERYRLARNPKRQAAMRRALADADLVLAATPALAQRLQSEAGHGRIVSLSTGSAAGRPAGRQPRPSSSRLVIGYMASASHDEDLAMVVPALNAVCAAYGNIDIALFGSISEQPAAARLNGRVERRTRVNGDYAAFRRALVETNWDIGLAPLRENAFNRMKTPTKWVEYAEAGIATLVSRLDPYLPMLEAGAALGVEPHRWEAALSRAVEDENLRRQLVSRADRLLVEQFGWDRLQHETLKALELARSMTAATA